MVDRVGQRFGNYRLIQQLGAGGFAEVYLGEHVHLKTKAAIKILRTELVSANQEDFLREAQTVANLRHPNIVRVLDFGIKKNIPFFIMDYAPDGTLRQHHPRGSCLTLGTILPYVKETAVALQYAHDQKLIHRDIKPENMLLGINNEVLLSDFGIAVVAHSTESLNRQNEAGTVYYMAPEQIQGKPRRESDQYALGIVVYEWLTGSLPFKGSFMEIITQHLSTPPPALREKIPAISLVVEQVVLKALNKDPHQRFPSVQDFATALEQAYYIEQSPIKLPAIPTTSSLLKTSMSSAANLWSPWFLVSTASYSLSSHSSIIAKWREPNFLDLIATGNDGSMWNTILNDAQWFPWSRIGNVLPSLSPQSSITTISRGRNQINLFVIGTDGFVYTTYWDVNFNNGQWSFWNCIEGTSNYFSPQSNIAAVSRSLNQIDLFAMGMDGSIYTTFWDANFNNGQWVPWSRMSNTLNTISPQSSITAVSRSPNQIDLFAIGIDGIYTMGWNTLYTSQWSHWSHIGNISPFFSPLSSITAISRGLTQIEIFAMGMDANIYATWWDATLNNSQWVPWYRIGNTLSVHSHYSSITAVSRGPNQIDLFTMGNDGIVYATKWKETGKN